MRIQCLMPVDHDTRCPWPHVSVDPDHLILIDKVEIDRGRDRASSRLRCNVGGCFTATVTISPADSMQQLVYLFGLGHQVHVIDGAGET